jgi:hypothetical protein
VPISFSIQARFSWKVRPPRFSLAASSKAKENMAAASGQKTSVFRREEAVVLNQHSHKAYNQPYQHHD